MRPIVDVAATLGIPPEDLVVYGEHLAKLWLGAMAGSGCNAPGGAWPWRCTPPRGLVTARGKRCQSMRPS